MTDTKKPAPKKKAAAKPELKYTEKQLQDAIKENIQSERTRLSRVNEDKIADALERQEKALAKENKEKLGKHTQLVRQNAYDSVLEAMRKLFLTKQSNLSLPVITINEYNELLEEFASDKQKEQPLI